MTGPPFRADKHYYAVYKPFGMLSQFTPDQPGQLTLASLHEFPSTVYPVGRLDRDSEGLLLLTDDKAWHSHIIHPDHKVDKTYLVQVEGRPSAQDLTPLTMPMTLRIRKKEVTLRPARVDIIPAPAVEPRDPPIRHRISVPFTWIQLVISEGKNRQVRKMCAHIGYPVLRLIRYRIGTYTIPSMRIGAVYALREGGFHELS